MNPPATETAGKVWWLVASRGILALALGIIALTWPQLPITVLLVLVGCTAMIDGVLNLLIGLLHRRAGWGWSILEGLAGLGVGALLIAIPHTIGNLAALAIAGWAVLVGAIQLIMAVRQRRANTRSWRWQGVYGVLLLAVGVFFIANPAAGTALLGSAIGVAALIASAVLLYGAIQLFRRRPRVTATF